MVFNGQARSKQTEYLLIGVFLLLVGYAVFHYTSAPPAAVAQVQCAPVLAQVYGLAGQQVSVPVKVVDSVTKKPAAGASIYVFDTQPYGWDLQQRWTLIRSMVAGQVPSAIVSDLGNASISVSLPQPNQTETLYMVIQHPGYWSELYTLSVGYNPTVSASSAQQCIQLFPYSTVQNILGTLVQVQAQKVIDGQTYQLTNLQLSPVGSLVPSIGNISLGVYSLGTAYYAKLQTYYTGVVNGGSIRITGIKFTTLDNLQDQGVKQISVQITSSGQTLYQGVIYDSNNINLPLGDGQQNKTYTVNVGGNLGVVELQQGSTLQIQVSVIADASSDPNNYNAGYLNQGEAILQIQLLLADPQQNNPISLVVTG
ncbi:MAG: hypothetical protein ACP5GJ_02615 [Nanopusillaceae archaeon]